MGIRIENMIDILNGLEQIGDILMKFLVFLGPNLKAVTGNSEGIDDLVKEVKDLVVPFETSELNYYEKKNKGTWMNVFNRFVGLKNDIELKTINLIHETFKNLRSAEGAFDLL
jgi:dynein heavy chain